VKICDCRFACSSLEEDGQQLKAGLKHFIGESLDEEQFAMPQSEFCAKHLDFFGGHHSHLEGHDTSANGIAAHGEGSLTCANGANSHAQGFQAVANGFAAHASGGNTVANNDYSHAMGRYNSNNDPLEAFMIGNGSYEARSNAFSVSFQGDAFSMSAFHSGGQSYAQMFEWADGNPEWEDRVGYFVTLKDGKLQKVESSFDYVLGVVTGSPAVVANASDMNWQGMFLHDQWGRVMYDHQGLPWINPEYDLSKTYVPRRERREWATVGMVGELLVRDDGSCQVNKNCQPTDKGIAMASNQGYFVTRRLDDHQVAIILK